MAGGGPLHLRPPFVIAIFVSGIPSDRGHIFRRRTSASALQHSARRVAFISPDATRSSSIPYCQLRARRSGCVIYRRGGPYRPAVVIQLSPRATARLALQLQLPRPPNAIPPTAPRHSTQRPTLSYPIHPNPIPIPSHLISSGRRARSLIWSVPCAIVRPFYVLCHCASPLPATQPHAPIPSLSRPSPRFTSTSPALAPVTTTAFTLRSFTNTLRTFTAARDSIARLTLLRACTYRIVARPR
ncbi:hypothetical protein C2E23DRAFT_92159 [Lenzites betulinus]|nr:hypothetical protein C2E23DRAFT_92159 [Lenzites betulinus]